jgi:divinyl chlorophyllide a 8-vinyl-reductase
LEEESHSARALSLALFPCAGARARDSSARTHTYTIRARAHRCLCVTQRGAAARDCLPPAPNLGTARARRSTHRPAARSIPPPNTPTKILQRPAVPAPRASAAASSLRRTPMSMISSINAKSTPCRLTTTTAAAAAAMVELAPAPPPQPGPLPSYLSKPNDQVRVLVAGPTGYIGKYVVKELVSRGYQVFCVSREKAGIKGKLSKQDVERELSGATVVFADPTDRAAVFEAVQKQIPGAKVDVAVSCLASRTGGKKDSWRVDHDASKNVFDAASEVGGAEHLVLLSAICVQKPLLEFQRAKLALEKAMAAPFSSSSSSASSSSGASSGSGTRSPPTYSIIRPTAFFKSLAGQIKLVSEGKPYVMFGDGTLAACKPISERDLASFIADCVRPSSAPSEGAPSGSLNAVLPIGGPGKEMTAKEQAEALFRLARVKPNFFPVPVALMDGIISLLDLLARFFPSMEDSAEFGRIGKYYATESMLVLDVEKAAAINRGEAAAGGNKNLGAYSADATPSYGSDTLEAFFERALREGLAGQELGDQAVFGVNE